MRLIYLPVFDVQSSFSNPGELSEVNSDVSVKATVCCDTNNKFTFNTGELKFIEQMKCTKVTTNDVQELSNLSQSVSIYKQTHI